jgi:hypothetical protein
MISLDSAFFVSSDDFFCKTAAARGAIAPGVSALLPANDPEGIGAQAFVAGMYDALQKEAGLDEAAACGFLQSLAELGWESSGRVPEGFSKRANALTDGISTAAVGAADAAAGVLPKLNANNGNLQNAAEYANGLWQHIRHPQVSTQAINMATQGPNAMSATNNLYNGNYLGAAGNAAGGLWGQIKGHLPASLGEAGDWVGKQLTPENMKAYAPHILAGLGTFAAGKMMGLGNLGSAAAGIAGGYGLPKLYDEFSKLQPTGAPAAPVAPGAAAAPVQPTPGPVKTDAQQKMDVSGASASDLAAQAARPVVSYGNAVDPLRN